MSLPFQFTIVPKMLCKLGLPHKVNISDVSSHLKNACIQESLIALVSDNLTL